MVQENQVWCTHTLSAQVYATLNLEFLLLRSYWLINYVQCYDVLFKLNIIALDVVY